MPAEQHALMIPQAAHALGASRSTVYRLINSGLLACALVCILDAGAPERHRSLPGRATASAPRGDGELLMPKTKAGNGEGSIRLTRDGQRWVVEISLGFGANGKRRRTRRTAPTLKAAKELRTRFLMQQQQGSLTEQRSHTVHSYALWWAREVAPTSVRPTTASDYEYMLRRGVPNSGRT